MTGINTTRIDSKITEILKEINPNEKSRFLKGDMKLNSKTRILHQYTDYRAFIVVVHKDNINNFEVVEKTTEEIQV